MAFTKDDLDALNQAIATGELEVEYNGRKVRYRSIDDLVRARELILDELAAASGTHSRSTMIVTNMNY